MAYTDQPYIGIVKDVQGEEVTTEFMVGSNKLKWPARPDVDQHPATIILECRPAVVPDTTGRFSVISNKNEIDAEYAAFSAKYL